MGAQFALIGHSGAGKSSCLKYLGFPDSALKEGNPPLEIPNPHGRDVSVDLLVKILRQAGISREDWLETR